MRYENVNLLKFKYLAAEYQQKPDPKIASEICDLLITGGLKVSATSKDGRLLFILASKYSSRCNRCNEKYDYGDSIFVKDQKAWHVNCGDTEDFEHKLFKDALEKGLIDDFDPKSKKKKILKKS